MGRKVASLGCIEQEYGLRQLQTGILRGRGLGKGRGIGTTGRVSLLDPEAGVPLPKGLLHCGTGQEGCGCDLISPWHVVTDVAF